MKVAKIEAYMSFYDEMKERDKLLQLITQNQRDKEQLTTVSHLITKYQIYEKVEIVKICEQLTVQNQSQLVDQIIGKKSPLEAK